LITTGTGVFRESQEFSYGCPEHVAVDGGHRFRRQFAE